MKEKKNCSDYELFKEILGRNPNFLEKYMRENLSENQIRKLTKFQKHQVKSEADKISQRESFMIPLKDKDHESDSIMGKIFLETFLLNISVSRSLSSTTLSLHLKVDRP